MSDRPLGPKQRELIEYIRTNGGKANLRHAVHGWWYVKVVDPPGLVTTRRMWSLVNRGILVRAPRGPKGSLGWSRFQLVEVTDDE